jgi:hypothetical protein
VKTTDSQIPVTLSALRAGRLLHPGRFVVLISVIGSSQLEGLSQLKNPITSSGIEHTAVRLVS